MYIVSGISNEPKQTLSVILYNGKTADLYLEFKSLQLGWFLSLKYEDFEIDNIRVVTSPNMIRQFKNLMPFGISITVDDDNVGQDPLFLDDFSMGRAKLYILDDDDVAAVEDEING